MANKKDCPPQAADNHTINNERPEKLSGSDAREIGVKFPIGKNFDVPNFVKRLPVIPRVEYPFVTGRKSLQPVNAEGEDNFVPMVKFCSVNAERHVRGGISRGRDQAHTSAHYRRIPY
jgi:hypothetical protein